MLELKNAEVIISERYTEEKTVKIELSLKDAMSYLYIELENLYGGIPFLTAKKGIPPVVNYDGSNNR